MRKKFVRYIATLTITLFIVLTPLFTEASRPILIEGAMECETNFLIEKLQNPQEQRIGGWRFISGDYEGIPVVVSVTSVGMTNAAAATVLGIETYHPLAVINQGTAGGHDAALHRFDIVLGAETIDLSAWVSKRENKGADGRHIELRPTYYYDDGIEKQEVELKADSELLKVAAEEGKNYQAGKVIVGKISSSNNWNRQIDRIRFYNEKYGSSCEEMETHAAAHICKNYKVPFLGIRILSNTEVYNEDFAPATGLACQQYVLEVVKAYAKNKQIKTDA
jgi:adenosylhomocysteine nucleosidase